MQAHTSLVRGRVWSPDWRLCTRCCRKTAHKNCSQTVGCGYSWPSYLRGNSKWARCSGRHPRAAFDLFFVSLYKSRVWYLGRRLKSATAPQLYSLRTELDYATGQCSGKAAQVRRSVSQETGQTLTQGVFDFDGRVGE